MECSKLSVTPSWVMVELKGFLKLLQATVIYGIKLTVLVDTDLLQNRYVDLKRFQSVLFM